MNKANDVVASQFPEGCDWDKPPGCHCKKLMVAQACYERCDDSLREDGDHSDRRLLYQMHKMVTATLRLIQRL